MSHYTSFMERCDLSLASQAGEVARAMDAIQKQLDHGHLTDPAVADGIIGILNRTYASIMGTQEAVEEFRCAMEQAGMIPPRK